MRLEHANLTVSDVARSIDFYTKLFGWRVRWRGEICNETRMAPAAHVGDDASYLSLFEAEEPASAHRVRSNYALPGVNHVGFVVDDLDDLLRRLAGFEIETHLTADYDPGRRAYFFDPDGIEIEVVEYRSI